MKVLITGASGFIGTNLIDLLLEHGHKVINFDKAKPIRQSQLPYWEIGDIMNETRLLEVCEKHKIEWFVHFAARTDSLSPNLDDYVENHIGTQHVLNVIKKIPSISRVIITSTQYVYKSKEKPFPSAEDEYLPHTIYGKSKMLTEQYTMEANLSCVWTIVRPTNVWGPWHMRYPLELWKVIDQGLYFHPVAHPVVRTYGYVKNVIYQIYQILNESVETVNRKVFYVGDPSLDSYIFFNEFSLQLTNKKVKIVPKIIFQTLAKVGDILRAAKVPFPIYTIRFKNMIEDYPAPTERTVEMFGQAESDLKKNVAETIKWLEGEGKQYFDYWVKK